ncbi:hypothetical protein Droror1_Dr00003403 [Drosera rotundifolia]
MGPSPSTLATHTLRHSPHFTTTCDSVFTSLQTLTQHAFPFIFPYQLHDAVALLHRRLSASTPLIKHHVPSPPSQEDVHRAYRAVNGSETMGLEEFRDFAEVVFVEAVVRGARRKVAVRGAVGVMGIVGIGAAARVGRGVVGVVAGVYAAAVVGAVIGGLSG